MDLSQLYLTAHQRMIAKAISEFHFEECFEIEKLDGPQFQLNFPKINKHYAFQAKENIWGSFYVYPNTLQVSSGELNTHQFLLDLQTLVEIDDIVLAKYFEELNNTLALEVDLLIANQNLQIDQFWQMSELNRQALLFGHPKALMNKGRIGWGVKDSNKYSPESSNCFKLIWLAVKRKTLEVEIKTALEWNEILNDSLEQTDLEQVDQIFKQKNITKEDYLILPGHPWQWDHFIQNQFLEEIIREDIIFLGEMGKSYLPQVSIRTLSRADGKGRFDLKLPVTILNTSSYRGLPIQYLNASVSLSTLLKRIFSEDHFFKSRNTDALAEIAGIGKINTQFSKIKSAPYRYYELFGSLWRENAQFLDSVDSEAKKSSINSTMAGALLHCDNQGKSLVGHLIKESGVNGHQWVELYFDRIVLPLYHLQTQYGIGLVSHGQNVIVRTMDSLPYGLHIKDFGGDLRFSSRHAEQYSHLKGFENIEVLPENYLIHDLYTGHFISLLRYLSNQLEREEILSEEEFYLIGANCFQKYEENHTVSPEISFQRTEFEKVLVNRVRFEIGYEDTHMRPKPRLGKNIKNPFSMSFHQELLKKKSLEKINK